MSTPPAEQQPSQGQGLALFPDPDHMSLERLSDTASHSAGISLGSPTYRASSSPDALAAAVSATGFQGADKHQLLAQIAELQLKLQTLKRLKAEVDLALAASEDQCARLLHENKKLAANLAHAQQRYDDNRPRRFEYTDSGK